MFFFAFTMFFNGGLIPTYLLFRDLGLLNNMWVFILPSALNVYNLIIARAFYENSIPEELHEAATLDGSDEFRFFFTVAIPLSKAILSVIMLYYLVQHWNDFFTGLVFIRDYDKQPLQIVLRDILLSNTAFAGELVVPEEPAAGTASSSPIRSSTASSSSRPCRSSSSTPSSRSTSRRAS